MTSFASSGTLFAQVKNGAPFDVFLSADEQRPRQLIQDGLDVPDSLFIYASDQLVLWSSQAELIDPQGNILRNGHWPENGIRHIALANPKTAPYGRATMEALQLLDSIRRLLDFNNFRTQFRHHPCHRWPGNILSKVKNGHAL